MKQVKEIYNHFENFNLPPKNLERLSKFKTFGRDVIKVFKSHIGDCVKK